jgi:FkbM family methyltransferase
VNIRRVAEIVSRGRVIRRRLPQQFGGFPIFVTPDSALQYWLSLSRSSGLLFDMVSRFVRRGETVWDVGANCGIFAFAAAHAAGPSGSVIAIEPDTFLVNLLRRSAAIAPSTCGRVDVLPCAVSDAIGIATFNIAGRGRSTNFLASGSGRTDSGGVREAVSVMTVTLDWLLDRYPAPAFVKIDVEGAEAAVLAGAQRLLREVKPIVMCECDEASRASIGATFLENGYSLYDAELPARGRIVEAAFNTLAMPPGVASHSRG